MTTTMEENDMNEFNQIRERFLADTRQHFLAGDTHTGMTCCTAQANGNVCSTGSNEQKNRQAGA